MRMRALSWRSGCVATLAFSLAGCGDDAASGAEEVIDPGQRPGVQRDAGRYDDTRRADAGGSAPDATPVWPDAGAGDADAAPGEACADGDRRACEGGCQGVQTCADGAWGACVGPAETCNDRDDDCDGEIDEDFPALGQPCTEGAEGCLAEGTKRCTPDGTGTFCDAEQPAPQRESCDGLDNDCDGIIDNGYLSPCCSRDEHCLGGQRCIDNVCGGGPLPPGDPGGGGGGGGGGSCAAPVPIDAAIMQGDSSVGGGGDRGSCGGAGPSVVYTLEVDEPGRLLVAVAPAGLSDPVTYVRTDCDDPRTEVACNDDGGFGLGSEAVFDAVPGRTYYIVVDDVGRGGPFLLSVEPAGGGIGECIDDLDCFGGACIQGACVDVECVDDLDCWDGVCVDNACVECARDRDCWAGEVCDAGFCARAPVEPECRADADCGNGEVCRAGACEAPAGPIAGSCAMPIVLEAFGEYDGNTRGAPSALRGNCGPSGNSPEQVYTFTLDVATRVRIETDGFDTLVYVRRACDNSQEVTCNDDGRQGAGSVVEFNAAAGQPYFVVVDGYNGASGAYTLSFSRVGAEPAPPPPPPEACAACGADEICAGGACHPAPRGVCNGAIVLAGRGQVLGSTVGGENLVGPPPVCADDGNSAEVVFALASETDDPITLNTVGSDMDTVLYVMGACEPGPAVACNDDGAAIGPASRVTFRPEPGHLYFVVVDGYGSDAGDFVLTWE